MEKFGEIIKMHISKYNNLNLFLTTTKGYLLVFNQMPDGKYDLDFEYGPINGNRTLPMFIDDNCSHLAFLDMTNREIKYIMFEYEFVFKKLKVPTPIKTIEAESTSDKDEKQEPIMSALTRSLSKTFKKAVNDRR